MKKTLHKLLSLLLVLCLLCSAFPAVFAADEGENPGEENPPATVEHTLSYTDNGDGTHKVTCSVKDCTEEHNKENEPCAYGQYSHVEGGNTHQRTCAACKHVETTDCTKVYETATGYHTQKCSVCGFVYVEKTACTDVTGTENKPDGKCDVCGADMPSEPETKKITKIGSVDAFTVPLGTTYLKLGLPGTVPGTAGNETVPLEVKWSQGSYDGNKAGTYTITGTVTAPEGYAFADDVSDTITVSVTVSANSIKLSVSSGSITVGGSKKISAEIKSDNKDLSVKWTVDDDEIATVSGSKTGATVYAVSSGSRRNGTSVTVTATLMSGKEELARDSVTVSIYPAEARTIYMNVPTGGVIFGEDVFSRAVGSGLNYVTFDIPSSRVGTLYSYNGYRATELTSGSKCFYKYNSKIDTGYDLDEVYFEAANNATGTKELTYVAYNSDGNVIATGTIELALSTAKISYSVDGSSKLVFDEDSFRSVLRAAYNYKASLSYVQFDMDNAVFGGSYGGSGKYGYLYTDTGCRTKVTSSQVFAYNYSSSSYYKYYDLDTVTYEPGTATGKYTVTIPFTAYGTGNEIVSGVVEIAVNGTDNYTITAVGTDFTTFCKDVAEAYRGAKYVTFSQPENGTLYYNYVSINDYSHLVRSSYAYYLDANTKNEYDLDRVYFVPAAGATKATIHFDVYSGSSKIESGSVTFAIKSRSASSVFSDVTYSNTGSWSADSVDFMYANGLIKGTGGRSFSPNATMTRGDLVLILYRMAGSPSVNGISNPFKDVRKGDYYYNAVLWAYKNSVVNGTGGTSFSPKKAVTREQLAAILYRYSGSPYSSIRLSGFTDADKVGSYAVNAMKWAVGAGIINGSGSKLDPKGSATRAQVAAMLHRYLTK